jgi:conjugal transfer ATP-binding protein TraC
MRFGNLLNEIPCWEVIDGTMLNANGIAEVGVRLRLPPSLTQSPETLKHLERGIQTILREVVPQGERLRLYVQCRPGGLALLEAYRSAHSNHPALELLGRSRFEMYEALYRAGKLYLWDCFFTLTVGKSRLGTAPFLPLLLLSRFIPSLASRGFVTFSKEELELLLLEARESRDVLVAAFKSLGITASAMTSSDVNQAVFGYLNPSLHAVILPEYEPTRYRYPELETSKDRRIAPSSLRSRLAKVDIDNGDRHQLWLGEDIVRVLALHSRPDQTVFGMANRLLALGGRGWYVAEFNHVEQAKAQDKLKDQERTYRGVAQSAVQLFDSNARVAAEELEGFNEAITRSGEHVYTVAAQLHLIERDELRLSERVSQVLSETSAIPGSPFKLCGYNAWQPFQLGIPFSGQRLEHPVLLRDSNASAFFPTEGPLEHDVRPVSVFQSAWGTLEPIDLDDRDLPNRNTLIVGQSGSGKSVLMQTLLADELQLERVSYTIIEKGESFATLVEALGEDAVRIPLDPERFSLNVMDLPEDTLEPGADKISAVVNLVKAMVFEPLEVHAAVKTAVLSAAVDQVYRRKLVSKRGEAGLERVFKGARLSDLRETLQRMDEMNGVAMPDLARACADELAIKLTDWTGDSPKGKFFDRETTVPFANKRVVLYDTSPLERYREMKPVALMVMAGLVADRWLLEPGIIKRVVVDEAHDIAKLEAGFDFLDDHQRRCRAANGAQILVSQTATEFVRQTSTGEKSLLENISVFWVFPVSRKEDAILRSHGGLTDEALEVVHELKSKAGEFSEVLFWAKKRSGAIGSRLRVRLSGADRWMFSSDAYDKERRAEAMRRHRDALSAINELVQATADSNNP